MARTLNEEDYAARRNDILDVAQQLLYTKGYEQMTIQDILDGLRISKGAFYHYFDSKATLLEALVERIAEQIEPLLSSIVQNPQLSAIEKLQTYFDTAVQWKSDRKPYMMALLQAWYADENAIVRQKLNNLAIKRFSSSLTEIIYQGVREGAFTTSYPDFAWQVNTHLILGLGEVFGDVLLSNHPDPGDLPRLQRTVDAYTDALERVLGCPPGSLRLMDHEAVLEWFAVRETPEDASGQILAEEVQAAEIKQ